MARTVLLADDSVTAQNMGRRILIDAGYEVITVNNGSAALKKIHENRPDLIVLDVYMPGYGGIEVCQRLKESSETSKIPILLSVGKMEPFKADEARRARADGHIVKPFEASELLAALTKLEDRIVPQAEPSRGRKGKPENKSEKRTRSWQVADPAATFDDSYSEKIAYLAQVKQRHTSSPTGDGSDPGEAVSEMETKAPTDAVSVPEAPVETPAAEKPRMAMPMSVYAAEALREHRADAAPIAAPTPEEFAVQEGDNFTESVPSEEPAPQEVAAAEETAAPVTTTENATSESLPDESASVPAVEGASPENASVPSLESAPAEVSESAPAIPAENEPTAGSSLAVPSAESQSGSSEPEPASHTEEAPADAPQNVAPAATCWVAENVALTPEEAALELDREMHEAQSQSAAPAEPVPEPAIEAQSATLIPSEPPPTQPEEPKSDETNGATFAAAASASSSSAASAPMPENEAEPPVASDAVAAWQNWQHIRESVMAPQTASSLSESVAAAAQTSASEPPAQSAEASSHAEADAAADDPALASIVDSVLAELKPRLMQEISKKLRK